MKNFILVVLTFISLNSFASARPNMGVIRQVTCNLPSGLGFIQLEVRAKKTLQFHFLKVNSMKLCGGKPGAESMLASIGFNALFLGETYLFEPILEDGIIIDVVEIEKVDYIKFTKGVKQHEMIGQEGVMQWWFSGPAYIRFNTPNIEELVQQYTN